MPGSSVRGEQDQHRGIAVDPAAVRRARREAGLSLDQVAKPELTRGMIWQIERGRVRPSLRTLRQIAERTGRPISYFLAPIPPETVDRQPGVVASLRQLVETETFDDAITLGERLLQTERLSPVLEAEVRLLVGRAHVRLGDGPGAKDHLVRARRLIESSGDLQMTADVLDALACAYYLTDDPDALKVGWDALHTAERMQTPPRALLVEILLHVGSFLLDVRDWGPAAECYERALRLSAEGPRLRHAAMLHDQMAIAYQWLGRPKEALEQAEHAGRYYSGSKDPSDRVKAENNQGWLALKQDRLSDAELHLTLALQLCDEAPFDRQGRSRLHVLGNLAELHIATGEFARAERELAEAVDLAEQHQQRAQLASSWHLRGRLHARRGEDEPATGAFDEAARLYDDLRRPAELAEVLEEAATALDASGQVAQAAMRWRLAATAALEAMREMQRGRASAPRVAPEQTQPPLHERRANSG